MSAIELEAERADVAAHLARKWEEFFGAGTHRSRNAAMSWIKSLHLKLRVCNSELARLSREEPGDQRND